MLHNKIVSGTVLYDSNNVSYCLVLAKMVDNTPQFSKVPLQNPFFFSDDSFDVGTRDNSCGGYNISGDCLNAYLSFGLNADEYNCVEYWGIFRQRIGEETFVHQVYYDLTKGLAIGVVNNIGKISLEMMNSLLVSMANRLEKSVGLDSAYTQLSQLSILSASEILRAAGAEDITKLYPESLGAS
jgi:hypothetical protein